jgi:predicted ATPase/DNA-binding XRE family transcriptional regulator
MDETFGSMLKRRRKMLDLTQGELAEQVGCAVVTLRKLESDQSRPSKELAQRLAQYLEVPPEEEDAFLRLARGLPPVDPPGNRRAGAGHTYASNLISPLTPLIGREQELARIDIMLRREDVRLISLCGPPGIGKTRLSAQVGQLALEQFADGVFFVALAPVVDPGQVIWAIAQVLGISETAGQPLIDSLKTSLRDRQALLILDNFEHLLEAAPLVSALLSAAPRLKVLATSREALNLYGEVEFKVQPLALPGPADLDSLDELGQIAAVRLFVQRAQAVNDEFRLNQANAAAVAELCARLDGLPLAIELAAGRSGLYGPRALLKRLNQRLELLTSHTRDLPARQRTLRSAIEWSYDLLDECERKLFRRLGIFAGSFDLEAIEPVAGTDLCGAEEKLASLVDKHLVQRTPGEEDEPRFMLLETLRAYAREQLDAAGEGEDVYERHACYFLALAESEDYQKGGITPQVRRWLARMEESRPDLLAALDWLVRRGEAQRSLQMCAALKPFWEIRGYLSEGRQALQSALALADTAEPGQVQPQTLALALNGAGFLALYAYENETAFTLFTQSLAIWKDMGDLRWIARGQFGLALVTAWLHNYKEGRPLFIECLATSRASGDRYIIARTLEFLGVTDLDRAEYASSQAFLDEALEIFRELDDEEGTALVLRSLGMLAQLRGRYDEAREIYQECRAILSDLDYRQQLAWVLQHLGWLAYEEGQFDQVTAFCQESSELFRRIGNETNMLWGLATSGLAARRMGNPSTAGERLRACLDHPLANPISNALAHYGLGLLALDRSDLGSALEHLKESLVLLHQEDYLRHIAIVLEAVARAAIQAGEDAQAAQIYASVETLREKHLTPLPPSDREEYQAGLEALRKVLSPQALSREWAVGQALTLNDAVSLALRVGGNNNKGGATVGGA